jgi:dimethylaniline monooxygenase (N-oxide forming)
VPYIPSISGSEAFTASGGRIVHTSTFHNLKDIEDKHVLVLGFGKSACDAAVAVSRHARSTTLIARDVTWKLPTYIGGALHYSYLFLTRMGEALFPYIRPSPAQRFLSFGFGKPIRALLLGGLTKVIRTQLQLDRLGLLPRTPFETIARSDISLATPDFVEAATTGKLAIERGASITSMSEGWVVLSNRKVLPANVIICGTGWSHSIPSFLPSDLKSTLLDENGDWMLYRHVLPPGVPRLAFAGFASSLFCPLTSEVTALWLAAHLESSPDLPLLRLPPPDEQKSLAQEQARWLRARTAGKHANATSITPFSMSHIDELLDDMDVRIGWWPRLREWLLPVDPTACKNGAYKH